VNAQRAAPVALQSCLYTGWVRHRRFEPRPNRFRYRIYLTYLDLAELPQLFDRHWLWSARRPALAWFRRSDFLGDPSVPLDTAVRDRIEAECGRRPAGPIRLLTHIRYFGYNFNPVSFYYVYDAAGSRLEFVVAEITNTPWDERHSYVLELSSAETVGAQVWRWQFEKQFHVSPFLPMDMSYDWRFSAPADSLDVHMTNLRGRDVVFDATLSLKREPITSTSLARALLAFPFITIKVSALIYWQALVLLLKRTPFYTHPDKTGVPRSTP
jgi:hypothetical protein